MASVDIVRRRDRPGPAADDRGADPRGRAPAAGGCGPFREVVLRLGADP
ncbi:hypothetical protein [Actinoplanes sp. CA-252034]